jgi:hypothetical protein
MPDDEQVEEKAPKAEGGQVQEVEDNPALAARQDYLETLKPDAKKHHDLADTNLASGAWDLSQKLIDPFTMSPVPHVRVETESRDAYSPNAHFVSLDTLPLEDEYEPTGRTRPTAIVLSADIDTPAVGTPTDNQHSASGAPWVIAGSDPRMHGLQYWIGRVTDDDLDAWPDPNRPTVHCVETHRASQARDVGQYRFVYVEPYFTDDTFGQKIMCDIGMAIYPQPGQWVLVLRPLGRSKTSTSRPG